MCRLTSSVLDSSMTPRSAMAPKRNMRLQEMDAAGQALDAARAELEAAQSIASAKVCHKILLTRARSQERSPAYALDFATHSASIWFRSVQAEEAGALAQQLQQQLAEAQERLSLRDTEVQGLETELEACSLKLTCCGCLPIPTRSDASSSNETVTEHVCLLPTLALLHHST